MKKNDKLIVLAGVVILVIASVGIYYWNPGGVTEVVDERVLLSVSSSYSDVPSGISVSDSSPFYALIATPLAVHYDKQGDQVVVPLYVENVSNPSRAVVRTEELVGEPVNLVVDGSESPEEVSLELARDYWESSDAVLLVKDDQEGYSLGLVATPIASYLGIPVIVTDEVDNAVYSVLRDLGVRYSLVCGNLSGYGVSLRFGSVDDVVNLTIGLLEDRFDGVDYVTLANPLDAWPPKILDRTLRSSPVIEIPSSTTTQLPQMILGMVTGSTIANYSFTIPDDYKYALVKLEVINLDPEGADEFGDSVKVSCGIVSSEVPEPLTACEVADAYGTSTASNPAIRDSNGNIIKDRFYKETILYDRGGEKYNVEVSGTWLAKKNGRVQINVEVDKLENPYYAMMKDLSTVAPYLTAYHKGVLFAKSDFAFYADDNTLTQREEKCPGYYSVRRNPKLAYAHNMHVFNKIHKPLNELLAKIADIPVEDLKNLRDYYKNNPIYIALVGDAEMLPRIVYDNDINSLREDTSFIGYTYGLGTPTDFIYGNIDPIIGDYSNLANDTYSYYPYQENIVGRLAGWDAQEVSALVVRTIFYNSIIDRLGDWKDNAALLVGGGQDFQRPPLRYALARLTGGGEEPLKLPTGYGKICLERSEEKLFKPMGFNVLSAYDCAAQAVGYSDEALSEIKNVNLMNRLLFFKNYVAKYLGDDVSKGKEYMEKSNFIFANAHGNPYMFGMPGPSSVAMGIG
ncbi:MAG: hypothetical protein J7L32_00245, partial [Thermoplasmata archaeon]|nr:hypothetical protein [Thermoplasmata archaeon]